MGNEKVTDCVIAIVPKLYPMAPLIGPALLKSVLQKNNYSCTILDFNLKLWILSQNDQIWDMADKTFKSRELFENYYQNHLHSITLQWIDEIIQQNPKFVGFCLFSQRSQFLIEKMATEIKKRASHIKIIIGGPATLWLGVEMHENNYCDYYVKGEGEYALLNILQGNLNYPGINSNPVQIDDLDALPIPDYSDYDIYKYDNCWSVCEPHMLNITGSRGCVRRCTFCDVYWNWPKFKYRSGEKIAEEMSYLHDKYHVLEFQFTDSLINGSIKNIVELSKAIIEKKEKGLLPESLIWTGQFICRSKTQMPAHLYDLLASAGFKQAWIGVESGSEKVRRDMKKMFNNEDLDFTIENCIRVGIGVNMLILIGFPTEGQEEFEETKNMFTRYAKKGYIGSIYNVSLGEPLNLFPGVPIYEQSDMWNIEFESNDGEWFTTDMKNTRKIRLERFIDLHNHITNLGYTVSGRVTGVMKELKKLNE